MKAKGSFLLLLTLYLMSTAGIGVAETTSLQTFTADANGDEIVWSFAADHLDYNTTCQRHFSLHNSSDCTDCALPLKDTISGFQENSSLHLFDNRALFSDKFLYFDSADWTLDFNSDNIAYVPQEAAYSKGAPADTHMVPALPPSPSALLLGAGLIGLVGFRRRMTKREVSETHKRESLCVSEAEE
ncbi:MAG: hypothetical protein WAU91_03655 [Desulfatitalea sp.]